MLPIIFSALSPLSKPDLALSSLRSRLGSLWSSAEDTLAPRPLRPELVSSLDSRTRFLPRSSGFFVLDWWRKTVWISYCVVSLSNIMWGQLKLKCIHEQHQFGVAWPPALQTLKELVMQNVLVYTHSAHKSQIKGERSRYAKVTGSKTEQWGRKPKLKNVKSMKLV